MRTSATIFGNFQANIMKNWIAGRVKFEGGRFSLRSAINANSKINLIAKNGVQIEYLNHGRLSHSRNLIVRRVALMRSTNTFTIADPSFFITDANREISS
jgi:hypothetical protein